MRLSTKIGLSATMASLIIGPLLGAAVFFNARSLLLERIVHEQVQIASGVMAEIDNALLKASGEMNMIGADNLLRDYLESPVEAKEQADTVADELEERANLTGPWDGLIVFDRLGRMVFAVKEQGRRSALVDSPHTRIAFESALKGKSYHSDRIVCGRTGQPLVIFAVPVLSRVDSGKVVGVAVSRYVWGTPIQNILDNVDATVTVHLFNSKGEAIGKRSNDRFDQKLMMRPSANPAWKTLPGGAGYTVLAHSTHGVEASLAVASRLGGEGWTLMMEMPLATIFAPIKVLARNTGLLVIGMLLVMGGWLAILGRHFIRPLGELVEGVRQVEQGRFDQKVMVRSKDEFGNLAHSFNAMVDKLQAAQDELIRKEKLAMLGQVAGSVGHELRNPLGVMSNAVYFLQTVLAGDDESVKEYLGIILAEISRSEHIVDELLAAVRTRSPDLAMHGVAELIGQILRQCPIPAAVTVTLDIPETISPFRVDALQMQQVLRHLISNSVEAMPEGGALLIRAVENRQEGTVIVSVQDSGSGMTPDVQAQLFQPLFTTKARGIGLGLVVVKNLIEANGGHIEVQSEPGKGTLFSIILPGAYEEENQHA